MAKRGKRQAFRLRGEVPALAGWSLATRRAAMPEIVRVAVKHTVLVAPKRRGLGSPKSIASRIKGRVEDDGEKGVVAAKAPHSHLLELGIRPHSLAGKGKKKGHVMKIRGDENILRRGAWHPGVAARPFMQKGLDQAQGDIEDALAEAGMAALERTVRDVGEVLGEFA